MLCWNFKIWLFDVESGQLSLLQEGEWFYSFIPSNDNNNSAKEEALKLNLPWRIAPNLLKTKCAWEHNCATFSSQPFSSVTLYVSNLESHSIIKLRQSLWSYELMANYQNCESLIEDSDYLCDTADMWYSVPLTLKKNLTCWFICCLSTSSDNRFHCIGSGSWSVTNHWIRGNWRFPHRLWPKACDCRAPEVT